LQTEEAKSFDIWAFKKALLSTLLQAVKAIKGGLIAIKGQIIKAKGHLLTKKGHFISAKGEAISNFGKHLASTALNLDGSKNVPVHPSAPSHPAVPSAGYSSGSSGPSGKLEITGTIYSVPNRLHSFHLIRYGPPRKHRFQQLFYCYVCFHCRGEVFTEPLPSNVLLFWLYYSALLGDTHSKMIS
jgi:hypothetical protein